MTDPAMDPVTFSGLLAAFEVVEILPEQPPKPMIDAALWYATKLGWPIFPIHNPVEDGDGLVCSCGRDNDRVPRADRCKSPGKHPRTYTGFKEATTDPEVIEAWWARWPDANIATPAGDEGCGFDVIDVDGPEGLETWRAWRHTNPASIPPIAALAFTPGNRKRKAGRHVFTPAAGTSNTTRALPGIDLRGNGGYALLPPSRGITGPRYVWIKWPTTP